jgi:hypothetical protein
VFYVVIQRLVERRTRGARQFAVAPAHDEDSNHA